MKPMFALSLSFEGIQLLHRGAGGWRLVGNIALDSTGLTGDVAALRDKANLIEPEGLRCKIIIPNDQIRYLSISCDVSGITNIHTAAREALEGTTPYEVIDLAYDVSQYGDVLHIAAVAQETLAEAEAFAVEHQFDPVCFTAIPGDAGFLGAPDFGSTQHIKSLLKPGEELETDGVAVVVIGDAEIPAAASANVEPENTTSAKEAVVDHSTSLEPPKTDQPEPELIPSASPLPAEPENPISTPEISFASARAARQDRAAQTSSPAPALSGVTREGDTAAAPGIPIPDDDPTGDDTPALVEDAATISSATETGPSVGAPAVAAQPAVEQNDAAPAEPKAPSEKPTDFLNRRTPDRLPPAPPLTSHEAESLTIFGARSKNDTYEKPKYLGFALTGALLLALGGVGIWASIFSDNGVADLLESGGDEPVIATQPDTPTPTEIPLSDEPAIASLDAPLDAAETALSDTDAAVLDALQEPVLTEEPTPENAAARYAVSGIWQSAPPSPEVPEVIGLDDLYIASIDSIAIAHDAIALPSPTSLQTDIGPAPVSSPAARGTLFALDEAGLVIPTAAGVLAPSGITVYLGRPAVVPPAVPVRQLAPTETENLLQARLARLRPRLRPSDLVEQNERSRLGGLTRNELAGLRPKARPQLAKVEEERDQTPTAQAVATSRMPQARPENFAKIVQRATPAPPDATKVAAAATVAPATITPKIPTSASVSKQATVRNAINLGRVNLIGVYGKPSSRRALIRLSNGRYKKVKVGDRIDGGRISAIGDSELNYVKRGRSVVLKMPKG